jgi:hypothetical protein
MTGRGEVFVAGGAAASPAGLAPVVESSRIGAAAGQLLKRLRAKATDAKEKRTIADGDNEGRH